MSEDQIKNSNHESINVEINPLDSRQLNIDNLKYSILIRKELKKDINEKHKDLRENKTSMDQFKIRIDNQDSCISKQQQQIKKVSKVMLKLVKTTEI